MKKIYLFLASIAMVYGAMAQQGFWMDYGAVDYGNQTSAGNTWFYRARPMNMHYTATSVIKIDGIQTSAVTTYVVVAFNSLIDDQGTPVSGNVTSLLVDSLAALIYHKNNSGINDTLIVKILDVDKDGYPLVDNAPLWSKALIGKDFDASSGVGSLKLNPQFTIPGGKSKFAVRLDFYGDLTDTLMFVHGYATTTASCQCGTVTSPTTVPGAGEPTPSNSFIYIIKPNSAGKTGLSPTKTGEEIYNLCGCGSPTQNISISAKVILTQSCTPVISATGATTICQGNSVTLTASSGSSYLWSNGATTQSVSVNSQGSYTVTVKNTNGCSATSAATTITVTPSPTAVITPSGPTIFCQGENITLTANPANSYSWSNWASTQSITVTSSGNYTVKVTDVNGCSTTSSATNVVVNSLPSAYITVNKATTFCQGDSVKLTASAGNNYQWNNAATTQSIIVNTSGNYIVTVKDNNGCSAISQPKTINVNSLPSLPVITQTGTKLVSSSAITYQWNLDGMPISTANTQLFLATVPGSYSITITDANGCSATSAPVIITGIKEVAINNRISISPNPSNGKFTITMENVKGNGSATLTTGLAVYNVLGERVYQSVISHWSLANTIDISNQPAGIYFLQVNTGEEIINRKLVLEK